MMEVDRGYGMRGKQRSFHLVSIVFMIFLATRPVLCSTVSDTNSKSNILEYDSNLHEQCTLGSPLESFAGQERKPPTKVAIIGGGIAGLSTAYFLQKDERLGNSTQFTIFEREARIGGRLRTAKVYGTGSEINTGGDTFDRDDNLLSEICHTLDVFTLKERLLYEYTDFRYRRADAPGALDRASLWDGQKLTINVADEPPLNLLSLRQILRQNGLKPRFWVNLSRTLWKAATDEALWEWLDWDTDDLRTYREMIVWAAAWARPRPHEADLRHFAATHSVSLKPQNLIMDGNGHLLSRLANHLDRDDSFSLKLGSTVTRIERSHDFNVYWNQYSDSGLKDAHSERFDYAIIAAPFSQSQIEIHPVPSDIPQDVNYQPLHVTHFITRNALDRQTFHLPPNSRVASMIWNTGQSTGDHKSPAPPFISIVEGSSDTCSGCACSSEPIFRVISKERFSDSHIATLLNKNGKPRKEVTFPDQSCWKLTQDDGYAIGAEPTWEEADEEVPKPGCVDSPDIRWIHREFWSNGMPVLQGNSLLGGRAERMELAPNLFYVSGFEAREGASMTKSVRNARKAGDILIEREAIASRLTF